MKHRRGDRAANDFLRYAWANSPRPNSQSLAPALDDELWRARRSSHLYIGRLEPPGAGIVPIAVPPRSYGLRYSLSFRRSSSTKLGDDLDL
jgi:hypothetical protein